MTIHSIASLTFLKNFARNPAAVGAIAPSGPRLVQMMMDSFDWPSIRSIVEYGPGTGVFTEAIEAHRDHRSKFVAIERSPELADQTRRRCPSTTVVEGSAADVATIASDHGIDGIDAIVCGLPWASFPAELTESIMRATMTRMNPGGRFATFAYVQGTWLPAGRRFSNRLDRTFDHVQRSPVVWRNLPPAFVYRCQVADDPSRQ